jgi:ElaB/YqjD/DUF883 family membrane-anchored ribosome-binding protein
MIQNNFDTRTRSAAAEDTFSGESLKDKSNLAPGHCEGNPGAAKDRESDFSALRNDMVKLTSTLSDLVQKQTATARGQMAGAVGAAEDGISQSASAAQDKLMSIEQDVGSRIKNNPWSAVAIAALVGLLIGKMS